MGKSALLKIFLSFGKLPHFSLPNVDKYYFFILAVSSLTHAP